MYATFYGLKAKPFGLSCDPSFFYRSNAHALAFDELLSAIRRRESLAVVTGDIGTGKTTLCRAVLKNLDQHTYSAFVADPSTTREDLLKILLVDFGVVPSDDLSSARLRSASRTELSYLLDRFLATLSPPEAFTVAVIDQAQHLSAAVIEEIRILSEMGSRERRLQFVFVGQPDLRDRLQQPDMRQLVQRVAARSVVRPLDRAGVDGYVAYRLRMAGGTADRVRFSPDAIDLAYTASGGVPRLLNRLCDRALHHGHLERALVIERETFARACVEAELAHRVSMPSPAQETGPRPIMIDGAEGWFAEMDARVTSDHPIDIASELAGIGEAKVVPFGPVTERRAIPLTRMDALRRRSLRWLKIAVVLLVLVAGAGFGLTIAVNILSRQVLSSR